MSPSSYADVFSLALDPAQAEEIGPGDLVRSGPNLFPHYEVLAVHGEKAWVRNVQTGEHHLAMRTRCRRIAEAA